MAFLLLDIYNNCKNIHSKINNGKSNRNTVIVVKQFFSLAKTIVVDVIVIYNVYYEHRYFLLCVTSN